MKISSELLFKVLETQPDYIYQSELSYNDFSVMIINSNQNSRIYPNILEDSYPNNFEVEIVKRYHYKVLLTPNQKERFKQIVKKMVEADRKKHYDDLIKIITNGQQVSELTSGGEDGVLSV